MSCKSGRPCGKTGSMSACYGRPFHQEFVGVAKNANGENVSEYVGCTGEPPEAGGRRRTHHRRNKNRANKNRTNKNRANKNRKNKNKTNKNRANKNRQRR